MKKLLPTVTLIACLATGYAFAEDTESSLPADSRIKLLNYDEGDVYTITTKYGYQTNIVFDKGEEIQTVSVGDRSLWQIIPAGNRLFIRPMDEDVITNMTVLTSKHSYQFDLKAVAAEKGGNIYVAKFIYPEDKPVPPPAPPVALPPPPVAMQEPPAPPPVAAAEPASPPPVVTSAPVAAEPAVAVHTDEPAAQPGPLNYNYTYTGPDELAPLQVYDDGKTTFFKYRDMGQPLPNVYVIDANDREKITSHYVKDGMMAVDAVAGEMLLRNSNGTIHVYNEMINSK